MLLRLILSTWAIGIGARFIVAYLKGYLYEPNLFDVFFDWGVLVVSGLLTLVDEFVRFRKRMERS
ncbi:MAG: hypothetical protein B6U95_09075 [Thermofilum sp. ex4484_82]|nr:MAG: hypothetical protein B6U95_09075 [Thermofilum sp. ex4484_82]OYT36000.1 MAG: hypothetical protein B6U96_09080 [Archaeoglobales archaeon ex4484_92]